MSYPLRHVSIRVPWHDTAWDGHVCADPNLNSSCLKLKRIGQDRDDDAECAVRGQSLATLPQADWPCCVSERMAFMSPFEYTRVANHPYNHGPDTSHGHFMATPLRNPPYSAAAVPFAWMLRESMRGTAKDHLIDVQSEREPNIGFKTQWVQDHENQKALLDCFAGHLKPKLSLCFFYAKQVPFVEDSPSRRILIGVGRVLHVAPAVEYLYNTKELGGKLRSMLWEQVIQHSIRPDFKDGFLLPYHAALKKASLDPDFDVADLAAFSPEDRLLEFSHASQLVTHDAALACLLSCADSLRKAKDALIGPWDKCLKWIDERIGELWKARGPCPGLGSALSAFGVESGNFVSRAITEKAGENADPWPLVEKMFADPNTMLPRELVANVSKTLSEKWSILRDTRRSLLKLISRFELTSEQSVNMYVEEERKKSGIETTDDAILANPYLIYELTRLNASPVSFWTIDRGVFPNELIRNKHPLPQPSALDGGTDSRRVRAATIKLLEESITSGNSLLPQDQLVLKIRSMLVDPPCPVDADLLSVAKRRFENEVRELAMSDGSPALQLGRLSDIGNVIRTSIGKRLKGKRLTVEANWRDLLDAYLSENTDSVTDELEEIARVEKTAALKEIAESRISVVIGPAGTGKTTLLSVLCSHPDIAAGDVLLLAPTGKARVRMEESTKNLKLAGYTIAQFLRPDRYDSTTGRYHLSDRPSTAGARTVIVDEASMLTEEMLGALLQALRDVHRLILIGDPRQLPPIGSGRPFVDIIAHLAPPSIGQQFPRVAPGYAELTIRRRQCGFDREDLRLAEWFSGSPIAPGEDDVFESVVHAGESEHVRFIQWETAEDLRSSLVDVIVRELNLRGSDDIAGFDASLGGEEWKEMRFFNFGAAEKAEAWQILSPVRSNAHGVTLLNRLIHKQFRSQMLEASRQERNRKYPKPMGPEEIVYGDKVINIVNTDPSLYWNKHRKVYPNKPDPYIANGEIGMAIGFFWKRGLPDLRWKLEVEFSSQPDYKYDFTDRDFSEESNPVLELAYALTVHKCQGSEFGTVILVLPNPCRLLSRELLYTALTRQKQRIVILHQGPRSELRKYSSDDRSETARRLTNIFIPPSPIFVEGKLFEEKLIHRTSRQEMVRSKSEVIIADNLAARNVPYLYERPLARGSVTKYPDFTVEDMESGRTFYWEHCGMLHVPAYRERWEDKLEWYRTNGILPYEAGGGPNGSLIITRDEENGGIDSAKIVKLISEVFG